MNTDIRKFRTTRVAGLCISLLVGATAIPAIAADFSGPYVGADLGVGRDKATGTASTPSKNAVAGGLEGGYNWNLDNNWLIGLDAFYDQTKSKTRTTSGNKSINFGDKTYGLDGKIGYTVDNVLPYFKLGYGRIKGTNDASGYSEHGAHVGAGVDYKFADNWSFGGELLHLAGGKDSNGTKLTDTSLMFSLKYYFNRKAPAPVPVPVVDNTPTPAPAPVMAPPPPRRMEKYTLSTTEMFAFNSAELKMSQPKLDEIANALNNNSGVDAVIVGYTDRIGSDKYNLKLSERRAAAVKDYLVSKGVDGSRLTTEGKGKANPVVVCTDKKRSALIECLEPNRRVEVQEMTFERRVQ